MNERHSARKKKREKNFSRKKPKSTHGWFSANELPRRVSMRKRGTENFRVDELGSLGIAAAARNMRNHGISVRRGE